MPNRTTAGTLTSPELHDNWSKKWLTPTNLTCSVVRLLNTNMTNGYDIKIMPNAALIQQRPHTQKRRLFKSSNGLGLISDSSAVKPSIGFYLFIYQLNVYALCCFYDDVFSLYRGEKAGVVYLLLFNITWGGRRCISSPTRTRLYVYVCALRLVRASI